MILIRTFWIRNFFCLDVKLTQLKCRRSGNAIDSLELIWNLWFYFLCKICLIIKKSSFSQM